MQIILLKDIPGLGHKGEIKNVSDGYARNFLLPQKLATLSTKKSVEQLLAKQQTNQKIKEPTNQVIKSALQKINNKKITFKVKASDKGTLFKAISASDIIKAVKEQLKAEVTEENILLEKPLKGVGERQIKLKSKDQEVNLIIEILQNNGQKN